MASWKTYEDVARALVERFRDDLGVARVEAKQDLPGASGTKWEIEIVAYAKDDEKLVVFECRQKARDGIAQEEVGGFAYRVKDLGAAKGYFVTPIGFQRGAALVAEYEKIDLIKLSYDASVDDYVMQFLNRIFVGASDEIVVTDEVSVKLIRAPRK